MGKETKRVRTCGLFLLQQLIRYSLKSSSCSGDTAVRKATQRPCSDGADLAGDPDTEGGWGKEQREFGRGAGCKVSKQRPTEVTFEQTPVVIWRESVPDRTSLQRPGV